MHAPNSSKKKIIFSGSSLKFYLFRMLAHLFSWWFSSLHHHRCIMNCMVFCTAEQNRSIQNAQAHTSRAFFISFAVRYMHRKWYEWRELVAVDGAQCVFMHYQDAIDSYFLDTGTFFLLLFLLCFFFSLSYSTDCHWFLHRNNNNDITCNFHPYFFQYWFFFFATLQFFIQSSFFFFVHPVFSFGNFFLFFRQSVVIINFNRDDMKRSTTKALKYKQEQQQHQYHRSVAVKWNCWGCVK